MSISRHGKRALASGVAVLAGSAGLAGPALAQANMGEVIVVTGSRIPRPDLESPLPITTIAAEAFFEQGNANLGDALNDLPQLRGTRQQQNPSTGIGIAGLNLLDLRGLGTLRTLVLVDGRRHVAADLLSNAMSPDINTIPIDLIERVDIVTGGNSAIYGSDAIAGVVNFVQLRDFEAVRLRANVGVSTPEAFGWNQYASALWGRNFAGGRGNLALHGEVAHQDRVFASEIPWMRSVEGLGTVDADPASAVNGSDGNPDSIYFRDITLRTGSRFGTVFISQPNAAPACGLGVGPSVASQFAFNCLLVFDAAGNLSPSTETARFAAGPAGAAIGGNLDTGREGEFYSVLPQQGRYNLNLLARFAFSDAAEAFVEGKYARIETEGTNSGAAGITGAFAPFDRRERIRLDNPFLTPAQRATIAGAILASGCNSVLATPCSIVTSTSGPLTAAQRAAIADGSYRFSLGRTEVAGMIRDERFTRETYRIVAGLRGDLRADWNYELSANYGRMDEATLTSGYVDNQRLMLALDAGRNPGTGQIQCRAQFDPAARVAYDSGAFRVGAATRGNPGQGERLAADIAACVPFNPFGGAPGNAAARDYFNVNTRNQGWAEQLVLSGFVGGDSRALLNLPGGPARFVIGAEHRREDLYLKQEDFAGTAGNTNNVVLGLSGLYLDPDPFEVNEAFAEFLLPILRDAPWFEDLTVSGAARAARYQGEVGTVWAYNAGVVWAPVGDVRIRASYGRAVRAPYLTETTGSVVNSFAIFQDPCNPASIGTGTQYRAANCQADLGPLLGNITSRVYALPIVSTFNADLQAETSDSWTVGAVIQPRWVPGLSLTIDYFDITVNDVINSPTAQQIANSCYDQPTLANQFCDQFRRWRGPGSGPFNEPPGEIEANTLLQQPLNFARRVRRGIDAQVAYHAEFSPTARLSTGLIYTHNFVISNFENPSEPAFENRILGELGDPEDELRWDTELTFGALTLGHRVRYIGPMTVGPWESYHSLDGRAPQNLDAAAITEYPAVFYHDLRLEYDLSEHAGFGGDDVTVHAGVDNVLDRHPPLGATGAGAGGGGGAGDRPGSAGATGAIYEVRGRQFYLGFKADF